MDAWDRLLEHVEQQTTAVDDPDVDVLRELCVAAQTAGVDTELDADDVARWLAGLLQAHRLVRTAHPEVEADTDLANLLRIVTRWLHPPRPR